MKNKLFLFVLALSLSFSSCEKDDICDANTPTTSRLVISFYDINDSSVLKNVSNLKIIAEGMTEGITFNGSTLINGSKVSVPLKTDADKTSFRFILNFGNQDPSIVNEDILQFDYTRENLFVSRACGFKTKYTLNAQNPFTHTDAAVPDQKWIQLIAIKNRIIDNENETHLEIYF